eukprot:TRINITY_DN13983_c0_g3_i2.p1 TRINITY_DN13983_c0_g3~~TRINITY_DN13983_c0_g3_i2.p1  ORF type:complete len:603 (-),score=58.88 TRINITY_DN13983_c0_g3_i2:269-1915(-)
MGAWLTRQKFHRDLNESLVYAYGPTLEEATTPGPTMLATKGVNLTILWENHITQPMPFFPVDWTLVRAEPTNGGVPMVVHLHGSYSPPEVDGNPDAWFTAFGDVGVGFVTNNCTYPNVQDPALIWYHDHTLGITRQTVYLGLLGMYVIRDPTVEDALSLPSGEFEILLAMEDKVITNDSRLMFQPADDPAYHPFWFLGTFGPYMVVNGKVWPFRNVQRRVYHLRILQAGNFRSCYYQFHAVAPQSGYGNGPFEYNATLPVGIIMNFTIIGTDGGYLDEPEVTTGVLLSPSERISILLDFSDVTIFGADAAYDVYMMNLEPLPNGIPTNSNTAVAMKFIVGGGSVTVEEPPVLDNLPALPAVDVNESIIERFFALQQFADPDNSSLTIQFLLDGRGYLDPVTEVPFVGTTEIWTFLHSGRVPHPIHVHLVEHRLLGTRPYDEDSFEAGTCTLSHFQSSVVIDQDDYPLPLCWTGDYVPASGYRTGWKDTTLVQLGTATSVLFKWTLQDGSPFPFNATSSPGYVWHCHILDHEDNEMMRPLKLREIPVLV